MADSTQKVPTEPTTNRIGPTKNRRRRPMRSVSQPPRKPLQKVPSMAEAAIIPCQNESRCR